MEYIFDSHAHYDDEAFDEDRFELIESLKEKGVCGIINCGCAPESTETALALSEKFDFVYFASGIHPENIPSPEDDETVFGKIKELAKHKKCVAIGEIGLDYHYEDGAPRERQIEWFEKQLILANELSLPVIVHDRDSHADILELLKKHRPKGVVHCFSGSLEMAQEVLKIGMYIGLGGAVTFKNAKKPVRVAEGIPLDRLLLETDCPYMAPVPFRGKRCDSSLIAFTAEKIAEIRGITKDEVLRAGKENAAALFGIEA